MRPVSGMPHDEVADLLGAYALDALDPDESALVEAHLRDCPRCSAEVARHHEVAGLLANSGAEAPAELWDRIADRLESPGGPAWEKLAARLERPPGTHDVLADEEAERTAAGRTAPGSPEAGSPEMAAVVPLDQSRRRHRLVTRGITLVATAAAVLAILLGVQVAHLNNQVGHLQTAASKPGLTGAVQTALEEPSTKRVKLVPSGATHANGPSVTVALTSTGAAYLIPQDLAKLPAGKTYQLWGQINGQLISLGLLGSDPSVTAFSINPKAPVSSFAITAERSGGVLQPTHQPVVRGAVQA
ncbi:MAG TPA: anti-sigma factor [Acidimicrobiales bacterium]